MPLPHSTLAAVRFASNEPLSWADSARVHVNTPIFPGYSESGFSADIADAAAGCACPMCGGGSPSDPQYFVPPTSGVAGNGLPIYNWNQAAAQIARDSGGWGAGAVVTYAFRATAPALMPSGVGGFVQFNAQQIAVAIESLALWSDVANVSFVRNDDGSGYSNNATMLFSNYTTGADNASAFAYYPGASASAGDVWVNISLASNSELAEGQFGPHTLVHEIGHAIGLAHPADYDASDAADPTYPQSAVYWQDSRMYTVMSYFGSAGPGGSLGAFASGPQLHDIAAAQLLYGANMTTRTGNTVYGFNSNTGHTHFTVTADESTPVFAIWDAGGNDTLDLSGYSSTVEIDLREEAFSSAGPGTNLAVNNGRAYGNISIARGAVIENGIGGGGDDIIIGNAVANTLTGNAGADRFTGAGGNDTLNGGAGVDTAIYSVSSTSAAWARNVDGSWTVTAGVDGTDTTSTVEFLQFTDRSVFLDRPQSNFSTDGVSDFLLRNTVTGGMVMWFNASSSNAASLGTLSTNWVGEGAGDFNGDGRDDILWRNTTSGDMSMWFMNNQTVTSAAGLGLSLAWGVTGVGDINGDLRDDLVLRSNSGDLVIWFMNGGAVTAASLGNVATVWQIEVLGDFNGDGRDDFIWRNSSTGDMSMWLMDGTAVTPNNFANVGGNWNIVGVGDLSGDGRDDVIWRDQTTGNTALWFMNGGTIVSQSGFNVSTNYSIADVGDYNGDGRDDLIWRNSATNDVLAWYMNGATVQGSAFVGGLGADWVINPGG